MLSTTWEKGGVWEGRNEDSREGHCKWQQQDGEMEIHRKLVLTRNAEQKIIGMIPTQNRATQNTVSRFGGVHDRSSKEKETY